MAAPETDTGEFERWLNDRLDSLEVDREVYGAYILGVLQEEESDEEKEDALQGILSAFLDEDTVEDVCEQIIKQWTECCNRSSAKRSADDEIFSCFLDKHTEAEDEEAPSGNHIAGNEKSLFKNTNVEEVLNRQKQKREQAREDAQKKKEMDKMQREKDKLAKQDRKEKEKKRTQKGERKR
ncbi:coiled-coil domain-containing protein 43 isoform X2 [Lates japonicus]|uniref:Coiled-coil domain-containing protein 43 n=1 Tax=Lates japonicus TaxID=270547 RepID=A0AAD3M7H2_LATJO|nr:coiled-coil domain-containing protein 43 isoform X2 [Lates japonicus]